MANSLAQLEEQQGGDDIAVANATIAAKKIMHRLVAATNKCAHKGFPEIIMYLTKKPTYFCSHEFVQVHLFNVQNAAVIAVENSMKKTSPCNQPAKALLSIKRNDEARIEKKKEIESNARTLHQKDMNEMNEQKRRGATKRYIKNLQKALHDNSKSNNSHTVKLKAVVWMRS